MVSVNEAAWKHARSEETVALCHRRALRNALVATAEDSAASRLGQPAELLLSRLPAAMSWKELRATSSGEAVRHGNPKRDARIAGLLRPGHQGASTLLWCRNRPGQAECRLTMECPCSAGLGICCCASKSPGDEQLLVIRGAVEVGALNENKGACQDGSQTLLTFYIGALHASGLVNLNACEQTSLHQADLASL